jgi:2-methylcitrate dehydratase PrpD
MGEWAAQLALAQVPPRVAERARLQRLATLAAGRAGQRAAEPFAAVAPAGPVGEIYAGACASIAHDWDDYLFMGHTGHSSVWTARALAPDPERALVAQIAGNEIAGRLGAALFLGPHNGQFWASIHCAGAAASAGVALGLDGERLGQALAIALYQPPFGLVAGFMGPDTKLLTAAAPAVQGAQAALLAAEGVSGPLDVIEDRRGLLTHFAFVRRPAMLGELGRVWLTDTLAFKPVPGCAYLQAAVDAVLAAGVGAGDIASIEVEAGYLTLAMEELGRRAGLGAVGVTFSTARSLAVASIAGRLTHRELSPDWLAEHRAQIEDLAARTELRHDWQLTLDTIRGAVDGGASLRDVPLGAWPGIVRRAREAGLVESALDRRELRKLVGESGPLRELAGIVGRDALRRGAPRGMEAIDTSSLRLTFPCRVRIRTRLGETIEADGRELGSCGRPLDEQRAVVEDKCRAVDATPEELLEPRPGVAAAAAPS